MSDVDVVHETARLRVVLVPATEGRPAHTRKEFRGPQAVERCRHEAVVLERLAGIDGVPQLAAPPGERTLDIRYRGTETETLDLRIRRGILPAGELRDLAVSLARILAAVHDRGVVHQDIHPAAVVLGSDGPMLVAFDMASVGDQTRPGPAAARGDATVAFLAPEQTGRTGRPVDTRSDLYALGATLYAAATGRPPFEAADPMELLHDQLARRPVPVTELNPQVPAVFAGIIDRMLEKEPDRRYQSAAGCAYDLAHAGRDAGDELGTHDFPSRLAAPARLIGRDDDIARLRTAFGEAMGGRLRCLLLDGPPGVGKSALIDELRPLVTAAGGRFVAGRFEQHRPDAHTDAFHQAFRALGRLLLVENDAYLAALRTTLIPALGDDAGLLVMVVPELGPLLRVAPQQPEGDQAASQAQLFRVSLALLAAAVSPQRPLVMVIDGLQWSAPTPIAFLDILMTLDLPGLFVVGTYRADEIGPAHPLTPALARWRRLDPPPDTLTLHNLPPDDLTALLAAMLRMPLWRASGLGEALAARTGGNPFDTIELINGLRLGGVLVPSDDGWSWDAAEVQNWVGDRDIGELLTARLARLPRRSRQLLTVMAALGGESSTDLLRAALGVDRVRLADRLAPAVADGLVTLAGTQVRFRHDRVRQTAYALLSERARPMVHLILGERLSTGTEHLAMAAQQYLPAAGLLREPAQRLRVAALLHSEAASLRMTNDVVAELYLEAAVGLCGELDGDLRDRLLVDRHRAVYSLGRLGEADALYEELVALLDPVALAGPAGVQIDSLTIRGRAVDAVAFGLDMLARLGVEVPGPEHRQRQIDEGLDRIGVWAAEADVEADLRRPDVDDPRIAAICQIITGTVAPAFQGDQVAMTWLVVLAQRLWAEHGPCAPSVVSLAHIGPAAQMFRRDFATGYRAARYVERFGDARGWVAESAVAQFIVAVCTAHWFEPVENSISRAQHARETLARGGDLAFACFTYYASVPPTMDCAPTLAEFHTELSEGLVVAADAGYEQRTATLAGFAELYRRLTTVSPDPAPEREPAGPMANANLHTCRALGALFFGDVADLVAQADRIAATLHTTEGGYISAIARLVQAVGLLAARRVEEADAIRGWMTARAADAPANFRHLALFLDAERAWTTGDPAAGAAYDAALGAVAGRPRAWHHALIAERAARFHLATGLEYLGRRLLADAREQWAAWGARAKVAALEHEFPFLLSATALTSTMSSAAAVDLMAVVQATQALSGETNLAKLRRRVTDILTTLTGATTVHLLTREQDNGEWTDGEQPLTGAAVPMTIVRYAERTSEPLVLDNAADDPRFAHDPYLEGLEVCAVLAVTVLSHGALRTMLVLENRMWRGTFTTDRLDAVRLIAGQLVVSMENAALYASLERKVEERTELLRLANAQLEINSGTDPLTGIANRRRLDDELTLAWQSAVTDGTPLAVAMVDIDHFKLYNDHLGHVAGDACLRQVAQAVARVIRDDDLLARYGGEEFTVVLPRAGLEEALEVANRIQQAVRALDKPHPGAPAGVVTVSVGVAGEQPGSGRVVADLIADADAALYAAKDGGRDRVVLGPVLPARRG